MTDESRDWAASSSIPQDVVDRRIQSVLDEYVRLTGAHVTRPAPRLLRLTLPPAEASAFRGRTRHLLALDLPTLEQFPDAELPAVGSAFWSSLVDAVRRRGERRVAGLLPITVSPELALPNVTLVDASAELDGTRHEVRRIVRLTAKVTIAAGTMVHEDVVQSDAVDLTTGGSLPASVAANLDEPDEAVPAQDLPRAPAKAADRLVPTLIDGLEDRIADRVERLQTQADRDLKSELARIDRYYGTLKEDVRDESGPGSAALRAIEHEHEKRRAEEVRRHTVRVDVQPLQVLERGVVVERATWRMTSPTGRVASLHAQRYLSGDADWRVQCPVCRTVPEGLTVCRAGHAVGSECTESCSICQERFCRDHGHSQCSVDGAPACEEHSSECWSCERIHCVNHEGTCAEGGHTACSNCLTACGGCGRTICRKHATATHEEAPRGSRLLCSQCVVYCEGGTSEPIGRDESAACGTCGSFICERHQVRCVVDSMPHCSKHLRRADRSRRFVCETHVAACEHEAPEVLFASDEIRKCVECGKSGCDRHGAECHEDSRWHCREHLVPLTDQVEAFGCAVHRSTCHVDGRHFSRSGTVPCEACANTTCRTHLRQCAWCGGRVCTNEMGQDRCTTCRSLKEADDLPDDVIAAMAGVSATRPKQRFVARDGGRFVVQLDLGWTRKLVVTVPHGSGSVSRLVRHSLFGASGLER